jgi:hypothetical protein
MFLNNISSNFKKVKLNRISALDPSALNFEGNSSKRVDKTDAEYKLNNMYNFKYSMHIRFKLAL